MRHGGEPVDEDSVVAEAGWSMSYIVVCEELCSGCRACQVACVAHHDRRFGTASARIRVTKIEYLGLDQPHVCRQCSPAPCIDACPSKALYRDRVTGAVLLDAGECIGCSACADACPFGMAALHPETGLSMICDLCGGDPACVKRCATGAINWAVPAPETENEREAEESGQRSGSGCVG
jgi:Fe-S-cluster-containing dehydrogenase component